MEPPPPPPNNLVLLVGKAPLERVQSSHFALPPSRPTSSHQSCPLDPFPASHWTRLKYRHLSLDSAKSLVTFYPHTHTLALVQDRVSLCELDSVVYLLKHWPTPLTSLSLWLSYVETSLTTAVHHLLGVINSLPCLTDFSLELDGYVGGPTSTHPQAPSLILPFLSRLTHFTFFSFDDASMLRRSLEKYTSPSRPLTIQLGNPICRHLTQTLALPVLASLTSLWLYTDGLSLEALTSSLAPLRSLASIKLVIDFRKEDLFAAPKEGDTPPPSSLPSVTHLTLHLVTTSHRSFAYAHLGAIFPGLKYLLVVENARGQECTICGYHFYRRCVRPVIRSECRALLVAPWKRQCKGLETLQMLDIDEECTQTNTQGPDAQGPDEEAREYSPSVCQVSQAFRKAFQAGNSGAHQEKRDQKVVPSVSRIQDTSSSGSHAQKRILGLSDSTAEGTYKRASTSTGRSSGDLASKAPQQPTVCQNCNSPKHISRKCPLPEGRRCYACGAQGHLEVDCPQMK